MKTSTKKTTAKACGKKGCPAREKTAKDCSTKTKNCGK